MGNNENNDYIKVLEAKEFHRGQKCNLSIVERSISKDFFNCIIRACTVALPIQGFQFFGIGELGF